MKVDQFSVSGHSATCCCCWANATSKWHYWASV